MVLGVLTLAWTIWIAIRSSRESKYLDRIDGLLKVKATLEALDTGGMDPAVDHQRRQDSQKAQLETISLALRRASATYVSLAHKGIPSYLASLTFFAYGLLAANFTANVWDIRSAPADQRLANEVAALIGATVCVGLITLGVVQWVRARRARAVLRGAGIDLRGPVEKVAAFSTGIRGLFKSDADIEQAPSIRED